MKETQPPRQPRASSNKAASEPATLMSSLFEAAHLLHARMEDALKTVDLSPAKFAALDQLMRAGEPVSLRVLSQGQHCAPSNMTQLMDRLEADGLVRRLPDPVDRRSVRAELTKLGKQRAAAGGKVIAKVQADFAKSVSKSDSAALERLVQSVRPPTSRSRG